MTAEQLRRMPGPELLELLERTVKNARMIPTDLMISYVPDPGEQHPLLAIGDFEIWPRFEVSECDAHLYEDSAVEQRALENEEDD